MKIDPVLRTDDGAFEEDKDQVDSPGRKRAPLGPYTTIRRWTSRTRSSRGSTKTTKKKK
jgi:hypothetical protein